MNSPFAPSVALVLALALAVPSAHWAALVLGFEFHEPVAVVGYMLDQRR
jgi:hypothetical protein